MVAYSRNKLNDIEEIFKQEGFKSTDSYDVVFRYNIIKDPEITLTLGAKLPINLPVERDPPIELVSFYISISFRPYFLDENFEVSVRNLASNFREMVLDLDEYKFEFNLHGYNISIKKLVEEIFPTRNDLEIGFLKSEKKIKTTIRDNILQNRKTFDENNLLLSDDIINIYKDFNLLPTNELPFELANGVPRKKKNWVVLFKKENPTEYVMEEPGSISYWRDWTQHNIWIRTGMESHTINIFYQAFKNRDFHLNYLFYDWIIYTRGLLKDILPIFEKNKKFDYLKFKKFSEIQFLKKYIANMKSKIHALFLPQLFFESQEINEKEFRDTYLFENPPVSLEELSTIEDYTNSKILMRKGTFSKAQDLLEKIYNRLKKFHHSNGQIDVLLKLSEISIDNKNYKKSIKYLLDALKLAKSGKISIEIIVQIHQSLIKAYFYKSDQKNFEKHLEIILSFLQSQSITSEKTSGLLLKTYILMAKLYSEGEFYRKADEFFKQIFKIMGNNPKSQFLYYYYRSIYYRGLKKESKQFHALQKAIKIPEGPKTEKIAAFMDMGLYYMYQKNDEKKAIKYIEKAEKFIDDVDVKSLRTKIKCSEIKIDIYFALGIPNKATIETDKIRKLKKRLNWHK